MPALPSITQYASTDPYHVIYDNKPIQSIQDALNILNGAVENAEHILGQAQGTQGSLDARLDVLLNEDGTPKTIPLNNALHSIAYHTDGPDGSNVQFVRMLLDERNKLTNIQNDANLLNIDVVTISSTIPFDNGTITLNPSDTISWQAAAGNVITAHTVFPLEAAHLHNYDKTPVPQNILSPDYIHYQTTSMASAFINGSLRVYINGIRLSATGSVFVPPAGGPNGTWTTTTYTYNASAGTFALNRAITSSDIIRIDFDQIFS